MFAASMGNEELVGLLLKAGASANIASNVSRLNKRKHLRFHIEIHADWWSLGILLYEMVFGIPPFYTQNHNEMYKRIIRENFQFKTGRDLW